MKIEFLKIQVKLGRITIDQIPEEYRTQVEAALGSETK